MQVGGTVLHMTSGQEILMELTVYLYVAKRTPLNFKDIKRVGVGLRQ